MKNFIIKRTYKRDYGKKCDFFNYLTEPIYTNCYGREVWQPDINRAFVFDNEPLKKYLGEDCEYTAKNYYIEVDFEDKEEAFKQEYVEVEVEIENITIPEITRDFVKIKKIIKK